MPHAIIEYSANIEAEMNLDELVERVHGAALETGVFPLGGLRVRAARREHYKVADGHPDNAFVHVIMLIGHGRDEMTRTKAAEHVFAAVTNHLDPVFAARPLGISFEMREIDPATNLKKTNLHEYVKRRQAAE